MASRTSRKLRRFSQLHIADARVLRRRSQNLSKNRAKTPLPALRGGPPVAVVTKLILTPPDVIVAPWLLGTSWSRQNTAKGSDLTRT